MLKKGMRRSKAIEATLVRGKVNDAGSGSIEGYLAVFGNVDFQGERFLKGAFTRSIGQRVPEGKVPLMSRHFAHGGDVQETVGMIAEAKEDDYGLWIKAAFLDDEESQLFRQKVTAKADGETPRFWGLSVGYELLDWKYTKLDDGREVIDLLEAKILEGTITVHPANELAVVAAAKAVSDIAEAIKNPEPGAPIPGDLESLGKALHTLNEAVLALRAPDVTARAIPAVTESKSLDSTDNTAPDVHALECALAENDVILQALQLEC